jgi:hypothetical protein
MARRERRARAEAPAAASVAAVEAERAPAPPALEFLGRHARIIAFAAVLLATARIVATYQVFNHTFDEPAHIATGMEWLDKKSYTWEPQHPPLARVAAALGPYLLGRHTHQLPPKVITDPKDNLEHEGIAILYEGHQYDRTLAAARAGILPFLWVACAVVYIWARRYFGPPIGALAVWIFSFLPPVLAHAGLATTDMALAAFTGAAFLTGMLWLERPDAPRSLLFGAATGLAVLSKFSSLVFLPAAVALAAVAYFAIERPGAARVAVELKRRAPMLLLAIVAGCAVIWAGYRFSFGGVPAPQLFQGIADVMEHNRNGHATYLLGERSMTGWWYFFPVVLAVKTPLAFLLLLGLWGGLAARRSAFPRVWIPLAFSAAILLVGMAGHIDIGVRHVLPIYIGLSIVAACAAADLLEQRRSRKWIAPAIAVLAIWYGASSLVSHPDYLPYFNELAGSEPEKIVVDSDLDWGQDAKRLAKRLREVGAREVTWVTLLTADFEREHGFPPMAAKLDVLHPSPGWNAIGLTYWKERRLGLGDAYPDVVLWPDRVPPLEKVGKSIYLWHFPER